MSVCLCFTGKDSTLRTQPLHNMPIETRTRPVARGWWGQASMYTEIVVVKGQANLHSTQRRPHGVRAVQRQLSGRSSQELTADVKQDKGRPSSSRSGAGWHNPNTPAQIWQNMLAYPRRSRRRRRLCKTSQCAVGQTLASARPGGLAP
jgi:hypothetical protein